MAKYVRFVAPFSYKPMANMTIDYRSGDMLLITEGAAIAALEKGVAVEVKGRRTKDGIVEEDDDNGEAETGGKGKT